MPRVTSGEAVQSAIVLDNVVNRMTSMFGTRRAEKPVTSIEKRTGLQFVKVDLGNPAYRINKALMGSVVRDQKMSVTLEKYFNAWLTDTTVGYEDIQERQTRLNELYFMYCNDAFISRACHLVADEATQPDSQKRLIGIEAGNKAFIQRTYELLNQWGVTQSRTNGACFDINLYGEGFWLNKITSKGVEAIKPLDPNIIKERLEFNPVKVAAFLAKRNGTMSANMSKMDKVKKLVDIYKTENMDSEDQIFDTFDSKLLGYELEGQIFTPPWSITHFRYNSDRSEFYPYGRPPLLTCLAPFKLTLATKTLQGLARAMSFPLIIYKVKSSEMLSPEDQYDLVEDTKEQYDAVTFSPNQAANEVYTLNTKVWIPENLVDVEVKEMKIDLDLTDDLEMYQDQTIVGAAIPKGYLVQEWGGFGNSAISLVEQFKPFARYVYTVQSCFLEELGWLIRLHYAITGEFDYNTPFVLTMRFPAEEASEENMQRKSTNINLCKDLIEMVKTALGVKEDEILPEEVLQDILNQYSFLDIGYLSKWAQSVSYTKFLKKSEKDDEDAETSDFSDGGDFGGGDDSSGGSSFGGFDSSPDEGSSEGGEAEGSETEGGDETSDGGDLGVNMESTSYKDRLRFREREEIIFNKHRYNDIWKRSNNTTRANMKKYKEARMVRMMEVKERYEESKGNILLKFLESENLREVALPQFDGHLKLIETVKPGSEKAAIIEALKSNKEVLRENSEESISLERMLENIKENQYDQPDVLRDILKDSEVKALVNRLG